VGATLLAQAEQVTRLEGDMHPFDIEAVRTTHLQACEVLHPRPYEEPGEANVISKRYIVNLGARTSGSGSVVGTTT
jgi:hypothetical protein